ncbi:MAG: four helix bundle protein [Chloroflexota bacterium]|nr:four helix bundle protein [Chloroflexota bacterium]
MKNEEQSRYKDLLVWQKSLSFADQVFDLIDHLKTSRKHYRLIEQLESAVTSVPMNIAEGKGRNSQKEFMHFLYIARGSLYETLTLLEIFKLRSWITNDQFDNFEMKSNEIAKMINGLIRTIARSK